MYPQHPQQPPWGWSPPPYYPPPMRQPPPKKQMSGRKIALIIVGVILFCGVVNAIVHSPGESTTTTSDVTTSTPGALSVPDLSNTQTTSTVPPSPVATSRPTATLVPTPRHRPTPTTVAQVQPTPKPAPKPTPAPACKAVNNNPWCYNFDSAGGKLITNPLSNFCDYFPCIAAFVSADDPDGGYVVKCADGDFSQSGGESGSCSHHGGELQPLYSH